VELALNPDAEGKVGISSTTTFYPCAMREACLINKSAMPEAVYCHENHTGPCMILSSLLFSLFPPLSLALLLTHPSLHSLSHPLAPIRDHVRSVLQSAS